MFALLCGVIPFLLSSCSDDDDNGGTGTETVKQITKLDLSATNDEIITYNYDSQNRISSYVSVHGSLTITESFEYDSNGKLVKLTTKDSSDKEGDYSYVEFSYSGNTVTATEKYKYSDQDENVYTYTYTYTLNDKGLITKKSSESGYYVLYTYDNNNNVTKSEHYSSDGELDETATWEYDDKNSLMSNMGLPAWYFVGYNDDFTSYAGKNNAVKVTYKYKNHESDEVYSVTYAYDTDGYPTSFVEEGNTASITYRTVNK